MSSPIVHHVADRSPQAAFGQRAQRRAETPPAVGSHKPAPAQPQFGGFAAKALAGSSDGLISLFQKITEIYLVGFLAIDVVALWITRIVKGLTRGAEPYDAASDPANQGKPPSEVLRRSFRKKMQGLNWLNAAEEALREVITGPAGFIVPAVAFSFATRHFGKSAVEMGYGDLTQMKDTFVSHLQKSGINATNATPAQLRDEYARFIKSVLKVDKKMLAKKIEVAGDHQGKTFARYIDDWTERWIKAAGDTFEKDLTKKENQTVRTALEKLNAEFEELVVKGYNRKDRLADRLRDHNTITARLAEKGEVKAVAEPLDGLLTKLTRFKDFAREMVRTEKPAGAKLTEVAERTYRKLVGKKFAFALMATFAASAFLYIVPRISQRNKHYPANRLLMEGGGASSTSGAGAVQPGQAAGSSQPVQMASGSPDINQLMAALGGAQFKGGQR